MSETQDKASPAGETPQAQGAYAAFAFRDFRFWIAYRLLSGVALQMKNVGVGWYIYDLTGSALALGLAGLATFMPSVVLALFTGHVADSYNRRLVVVLSFGLCAIGMGALAVAVLMGAAPLWLIYVSVVLIGIGRAFGNPASQAITPNLVPREAFANAVTWYSSFWQVATVGGPAIGGLLYIGGPSVCFVAATACFVAACVMVAVIRTPLDPPKSGKGPISIASLLVGLHFMWSRPVMFGAVALDLVAVLFGGVAGLLPIVAKDILMTGPWGLGLLRSCPAVGAIAMSAVLAYYPITSKAGRKMLLAVVVYGLAIAAFGLSETLWLSMIALCVVGASDSVSVVVRHTMVQSEAPDEMRGRVAAVNSVFISGSADLGEFRAGTMGAFVGAANAIILGGLTTSALALLWFKLFPDLARRDKIVN
jgi:MFS family permease